MRAEDTLQYMADFYPELFPTRKHCLNDLFCYVNNGYEWIDGELVYTNGDKYKERYKLRKPIEKAEFEDEKGWYVMNELYQRLHSLDENKMIPMRYDFEWHLPSKSSMLFTYPDDIKDDWKMLVEECKQMLIADGIDLDDIK